MLNIFRRSFLFSMMIFVSFTPQAVHAQKVTVYQYCSFIWHHIEKGYTASISPVFANNDAVNHLNLCPEFDAWVKKNHSNYDEAHKLGDQSKFESANTKLEAENLRAALIQKIAGTPGYAEMQKVNRPEIEELAWVPQSQ